jgi:integrase/recombinase XerD
MGQRAAGVCLGNRTTPVYWYCHPPASIPVETGPAPVNQKEEPNMIELISRTASMNAHVTKSNPSSFTQLPSIGLRSKFRKKGARSLLDQISTIALIDDYCKNELELKRELSPLSIVKYKQQLSFFCDWLGERKPSAELGALFISELRQSGYKNTSVHSYYAAIRPFLYWLNIPFDLKLKKIRRLPRYHTKDEFDRLIQSIAERHDAWAKNKERDILIVKTLAYTGLRRSELLSLRCQDIKGEFLFIYHAKGNRDRVIPLNQTLKKDLSNYTTSRHLLPADRLFAIGPNRLDRMIRDSAARAGLTNITPHQLRHFFATRLVEKGAEVRKVQELLGHEDITSTAIYLDVVPGHLKQTIELLNDD